MIRRPPRSTRTDTTLSLHDALPISTLLGYPVVEAEDMPAVAADSLAIAFGNFRAGYLIADRGETRILRDPFSNKPFVHFYATKRVGGAIVDSNAIKLMKDRKSTRLNSSHKCESRMPSSA